jgi:serine/threonine protein kinase
MKSLLQTEPENRISAKDALSHPFLKVWKQADEIDVQPIIYDDKIGDCSLIGLELKGLFVGDKI